MVKNNNSDSLQTVSPKNIGEELVISFHEQFAQNQNHHQKLFLQILAVLFTVLVGFGYLYLRVDTKNSEINVTIETLYYYLTLSEFLLSMAIAVICNMDLGFRRDQLMAANIRVMSDVMTINSNDNYFFKQFNPYGRTSFFEWIPEFHKIFLFSLLTVKFFLLIGVLLFPKHYFYTLNCFFFIIIFIIIIISFIIDYNTYQYYRNKWKNYSDNAPSRLKNDH